MLQSRQKTVTAVLDGEEAGEQLDLFDMLINELRKGK